MSTTPISDAAACEGAYLQDGDYHSTYGKQIVHISVARQLERDLAETEEEITKYKDLFHEQERKNDELERELEKVNAECAQMHAAHNNKVFELQQTRADLKEVKAELENFKRSNKRDGEWLDDWGACKVCDGEIPHGHHDECHIYKLEQQARGHREDAKRLADAGSTLRNMLRAKGHMGYSSHPGAMDCQSCKAETAMGEALTAHEALNSKEES